jgi:hypothetical protein
MAADEGTSGDTTTAPMVEVGAMSTGAKKTRRRVKKVAQEEKVTKTHVATAEELTQAKLDPLLKGQSLFTPQGRPRVQQQIRCVRGAPTSALQPNSLLTQSWALHHSQRRYNDLLDAIRNKEVKELVMTPQGTDRCMALFKDGRVRLLQLPADDHVVADMMSVHGVSAVLAKSEPPPDPSMAATRRMVRAVAERLSKSRGASRLTHSFDSTCITSIGTARLEDVAKRRCYMVSPHKHDRTQSVRE